MPDSFVKEGVIKELIGKREVPGGVVVAGVWSKTGQVLTSAETVISEDFFRVFG